MSFTKREGGSDCSEMPRQKKVRVSEDQVGGGDELEVQIVGFKLGSIEKGGDHEKRELGNLGSSRLMVDHVSTESLNLDLNGENLGFDLNFPAMEVVEEGIFQGCIELGQVSDRGMEIIHISSDEDESDGEDVYIIDENDARRKGKEIDNGFVDESIERLDMGLVTMELGTTSNGFSSMSGERRYTREEKGKAKIDDSWLSLGTKLMHGDLLSKNHELINLANSGGEQMYEYNCPEETIQLEVTEDSEVERERNTAIARSRQRDKTIRNREILRRRAPQLAHFNPQQEQDQERQQQPIETEKNLENFMGPFSTAMNLVKERNLKHSGAQQLINWQPLKDRDRNIPLPIVPSLLDLSMKVLAKNADAIVSLEHVPDALKHKLTYMLCDSRKMNIHALELLVKASSTEIRIKDCSWITEEQFTKEFGSFDPKNLKVLQLDLCGQCVLGDSLCKTLTRSPNSLPDLAIISLKGACRLTDTALKELVTSAPLLQSINLGQCSLLTYTSIDILADSLGAILRELYIDNCQRIDAMLIAPALKKFKHLEVLSVAGIQTVCDEFLIDIIAVCGQNMKELDVADCPKLTDISLEVIGNTCSGLCSLNISNLHKLTDLSIQYLANGCQSIQTLKLQQNSFSDEAIAAFLEVSGKPLKQLSLNNVTKVSANTALSLAKYSKELVSLDLSWCRKITNEALGLIVDSCLSLKLLKLFGCTQIDNEFLKGHSNSLVRIIGLNMTPVLEHLNLLEHEEALLRYSPLAFSSDSQSSDHPDI